MTMLTPAELAEQARNGRKLTTDELRAVVDAHAAWLRGEEGGTRADLARANLAYANLANARLAYANLANAYLAGTNLAGTNLAGAKRVASVGPIDGWLVYAVYWDDGPRIQAGCRWFTLAEAREHWGPGCADRREHGDRMLVAVDALLSIGRAHGYPACDDEAALRDGLPLDRGAKP